MIALVLTWVLRLDAGAPLPMHLADSGAVPRADDAELIENLELLENLDTSSDFELLRELSLER